MSRDSHGLHLRAILSTGPDKGIADFLNSGGGGGEGEIFKGTLWKVSLLPAVSL